MAYFRDWFGRSAEDAYTSYDSSKRAINWDKGYDNYSDYFFGKRSGGKASSMKIQDAASLLATMSKVVGIDSSKFKAACLSPRKDQVVIPTDMLKDSTISTDIFIGAALQNMAKINYSSQEELAHDHRQKKALNLQKTIYNILNSERLNNLMAEDTPGYLKFVQKFKKHKYKDRPEIDSEDKFQRALELFDRIIRFPEDITDEELEEFKEPLEFIKKNIEKAGGIPSDQKECVKLSKKISKVLEKYIEETPPPDDEGEGEDGEDDDGEGTGPGGPSAPMSDEEKKEQEERRKEFMKSLVDTMEPEQNADKSTFEAFMEDIKNEEEAGGKIDRQVEFLIEKDHPRDYDASAKKVDHTKASVIANLLKRKNRDYQFSLKSMRSGRLDTDKLAEARQGVQTIYERMGEVKTNKLCVTVLVDESGSMHGSKADKAREAAIFLKESLEGVPDVELFIYGHTADIASHYVSHMGGKGGHGTTQILVYKEPGTYTPPKSMGGINGRYENRDGVAILATAKRVRQKTQNQGVFIVISDGEPSAQNYGGTTARQHVKKSAIEVEKMGFQVIQVTIGGHRSKEMFKNVIDMDDVSKFPTQFVGFLKTKINSLIKEKVTM
jgi:cobalamin biosynthesis protein CobT